MEAEPAPNTVLATVLFTDIVGSTERAAALGDRGWRDLLAGHHAAVRARTRALPWRRDGHGRRRFLRQLRRARPGDPCARAIPESLRELDLDVRAGIPRASASCTTASRRHRRQHGSRVAAEAGPGEVLVSSTVKDLVAGSGLRFDDRDVRALKGIAHEWRVYAVEDE